METLLPLGMRQFYGQAGGRASEVETDGMKAKIFCSMGVISSAGIPPWPDNHCHNTTSGTSNKSS